MFFRPVREHPKRVRLFKNNWLELTTLTPFPLFFSVWLLIDITALILAFRDGPLLNTLLGLLIGLVCWVFFEYFAHRYLFHLKLSSLFGKNLIFLIHGNHHADPSDPLRNLMPLTVSLPLGGIIWLACHFSGLPAQTAFFAGFACGYTLYDTVHWACHQTTFHARMARTLKKHHLLHHHARFNGNYAVTTPILDRLFRTFIRPPK